MSSQNALQRIELELCQHALLQFRVSLDDRRPRPPVDKPDRKKANPQRTTGRAFLAVRPFDEWLSIELELIPAEIADTLWSGILLPRALTAAELDALVEIAEGVPIAHQHRLEWQVQPKLEQLMLDCCPLLQSKLPKAVADLWVRRCWRWVRRLQNDDLWIADGLEILAQWLAYVRYMMKLVDEVLSTDLKQKPSDPPKLSHSEIVLETLRKLLNAEPSLRTALPHTVVKRAKVQNQLARQALRKLEKDGLYTGFIR